MMDTSNPWVTLSKQVKYENAWIKVEEHQVLNPSGNPGIYGKVHFKNIAIAVLPMSEDGYTWLVGQYRYPLHSYEWELPEGGCKEGEDPIAAAQRELAEETGLMARTYTRILDMQLSNSVSDELSISFIAQNLSQGFAHPEDNEKLVVRKILFEDAVQMVLTGEIRDALSVATILKAKLFKL